MASEEEAPAKDRPMESPSPVTSTAQAEPAIPNNDPQTSEPPSAQEPEKLVPASHLIQLVVEQHDPELHTALTTPDKTEEASVQSLRDWYVSVREQIKAEPSNSEQKRSLEERLEEIASKGGQAQANTVLLTPADAEQMNTDLGWFEEQYSSSEPVSIGELRQWYRANAKIDAGSQTDRIKQLATTLTTSGEDSIKISRTDYVKMQADLIGAESAPNIQKIWQLAELQQRIQVNPNGQRSLPGENYEMVLEGERLTLTNKNTAAQFSLESGQVVKNTLTQADADQLKRFANQTRIPVQTSGVER